MPLFNPASSAVYKPGGSVAAMAASRLFPGASPAAAIRAAWPASSCQSLLAMRSAPLESRNCSVGSSSALATPPAARLGPMPRAIILSGPPVPRMKPAMTMSLPVPTNARVLILASFAEAAALRSYTSTNPTPAVLFLPRTIAV